MCFVCPFSDTRSTGAPIMPSVALLGPQSATRCANCAEVGNAHIHLHNEPIISLWGVNEVLNTP